MTEKRYTGGESKVVVYAVLAISLIALAIIFLWIKEKSIIQSSPKPSMEVVAKSIEKNDIPNSLNSDQSIATTQKKIGYFANLPNSREGLPLEPDPFGASSIEDQGWLDRNGFPNVTQWEAYSSASLDLLEYAANSGDPMAAVFSNSRKVARGDAAALNGLLKEAQASGSLFALSMLQASLVASNEDNAGLAYSISRVTEARGDPGGVVFREATPSIIELSAEARVQAEEDARVLLEKMRRTTRKKPFFDPRPLPQK